MKPLLFLGLLILVTSVREPASRAQNPDPDPGAALDSVMTRLRSRTDATLSTKAWERDHAYRDSVTSAFKEAVAADGLDRFIETHRSGSAFRSGFNIDPQNADVSYSKVDGLTLLAPATWHVVGSGLRADVGGKAGYAFASEAFRYRAGVNLSWRSWSTNMTWLDLAPRWGDTEVTGGGWFALFGGDEHQYLDREGYTASLGRRFGPIRVEVGASRFDEQSLAYENPFHITGTSSLHRKNVPISDGVRRPVHIAATYTGRQLPVRADLRFERSTRGLTYDAVTADVQWEPVLPWDDVLDLRLRGHASASDDGGVPIQLLADPAGRSGVRGYPLRTRIGTHALTARAELLPARDWFARARLPYSDRLRLQLVPFFDVGAAWSPDASGLKGSTLPDRDDWFAGAGVGVRRSVGMAPVLSHVRFDFAWRLDGSGGRPVTYFVLEADAF